MSGWNPINKPNPFWANVAVYESFSESESSEVEYETWPEGELGEVEDEFWSEDEMNDIDSNNEDIGDVDMTELSDVEDNSLTFDDSASMNDGDIEDNIDMIDESNTIVGGNLLSQDDHPAPSEGCGDPPRSEEDENVTIKTEPISGVDRSTDTMKRVRNLSLPGQPDDIANIAVKGKKRKATSFPEDNKTPADKRQKTGKDDGWVTPLEPPIDPGEIPVTTFSAADGINMDHLERTRAAYGEVRSIVYHDPGTAPNFANFRSVPNGTLGERTPPEGAAAAGNLPPEVATSMFRNGLIRRDGEHVGPVATLVVPCADCGESDCIVPLDPKTRGKRKGRCVGCTRGKRSCTLLDRAENPGVQLWAASGL